MAKISLTRLVAILVIGGSLGVLVAKLPPPRERTPEEKAADKMRSALFRCENQTEAVLADPDGFEPEPYGQWMAEEASENRYVFRFKARAKNAFGALVWAEFRCTVNHDGARWEAGVELL